MKVATRPRHLLQNIPVVPGSSRVPSGYFICTTNRVSSAEFTLNSWFLSGQGSTNHSLVPLLLAFPSSYMAVILSLTRYIESWLSNLPSCMFLAGLIADDIGVLSIHGTKDWLVTQMPVVVLRLGRWRVFSGQYEWRRPCTSGRSQCRQHRCALPIALIVDVALKDLFEDHPGRRNLRGVMVFSSFPTDDRW